jgi:hypothetical protein
MARAGAMLCVLAAMVIGGPPGASAQPVGSVGAASLLGVDQAAAAPAPTILGCDNFTGTTGASMSGRAATVAAACAGRTWTVHLGGWTIQSAKAASNSTAGAAATLNTATVNSTAQVVLSALNTGGRLGGVVLSHNGITSYLAAVMIDGSPDRVELRLVLLGVRTVLATANPTFATTNTLSMARSGGTLTVAVNGATAITHTLTATQLTTLGSGARSGLFGGHSSVRFDDFVVTSP